MENEAFIDMDNGLPHQEEGKEDGDVVHKPSKRRSTKYSVKLKQATMELSELSKQINFPIGESTDSLIYQAIRRGRRSILKDQITKAKESDSIDSLDNIGFAALHHTTRYNRLEALEQLVKNGANVNVASKEDQFTPLHIAARFGWFDATEILLKNGADPTLQTSNGTTPLHLACRRGNLSITELLLKQPNVVIDVKDKSLRTPLYLAASLGNEDVVNMLIDKGADCLATAADKTTPLHVAVLNGCSSSGASPFATALLKKAFEMSKNKGESLIANSHDMDGYTLLHIAALSNGLEVMSLALDEGVDVDLPNLKNLRTALHIACKIGNLSMVEFLVQKGANVHAKDFRGQMPLHYAAEMGNTAVIEFLVDKGADVDARDYTNKTPFLVMASCPTVKLDAVKAIIMRGAKVNANEAFMKNCLHLCTEVGNVQMIEFLLECDCAVENLYTPDVEEKMPLHFAAVCDNIQILHLILKKQTRLNFQDEDQETPLYVAAKNNCAEHVEVLGRAGASVGERDDQGQTALHAAASNGSKKVCKILLTLGADVNSKDNENRTPLMCAAEAGCAKTSKTLLDRHAHIDDASNSGDTALLLAIRNHNSAVVELLLDCNVNVAHRDLTGFGVMETAIKYDDQDSVNVICSHDRWKEVLSDAGSHEGHRPMQLLIRFFPEAAKIVMNNCIQRPLHTNSLRPDYTITYDFQFLDPGPDDPDFVKGNRYFGPTTMVKYGRRDLLLHPLTQTLLDIKWYTFGSKVYYLSFLLYLCFIVSYSYFLVVERQTAVFEPHNGTQYLDASKMFETKGDNYRIAFLILFFVVFQLLKEIGQMFIQRLKYFTQAENLLEWLLYTSCLAFVLPYVGPDAMVDFIYGSIKNPSKVWITAIVSIFLGYVNLVLFLRRFSLVGIYITMFLVVFKSLLRVMLVFMEFVVAFSVVFYILFKEQPSFNTIDRALSKTIVMTVGEIDFTSIWVDSIGEYSPTTGRPLNSLPDLAFFFCALFVLAMSITLMNLLIGIAIGDIDKVQRSAELKRLSMQVEFVAEIEEKYPRCITRRLYNPTIEVKPNKKSFKWRIQKIQRFFQGALKDLSSETDEKSTEQCQSNELTDMAVTLEKNRKQIKALVTAMEAQTTAIQAMAAKLNTEVKPETIDSIDLTEMMRDDIDDQEKPKE